MIKDILVWMIGVESNNVSFTQVINKDERYKLNCPYMKLLDQCALISLQSITRTVHVVPSFVDNTKFYINQFA